MNTLAKIEKFLGGLQFAVIIILTFTAVMIYGTFQESFHGTEYANLHVYKSWWFTILQFGLFLSVFMAALLRLPPKKRLYGFYTIHSGIIIIIAGSFITFYAGIDGSITLGLNSPNREVVLPDDIITLRYKNKGQLITYDLPSSVSATEINETFEDITIKKYYPFSEDKLIWAPSTTSPVLHASTYLIQNEFVGQEFTMSLHDEIGEFAPTKQLGPLQILYLPKPFFECFKDQENSGLILWDQSRAKCISVDKLKADGLVDTKTTSEGKEFVAINYGGVRSVFIPKTSPWPITNTLRFDTAANYRIFNQNLFTKSPALFVFGEAIAYYDQDKWQHQAIKKNKETELPWMNFKLTLINHEINKKPTLVPEYTTPVQDGGSVVIGNQKSLLIKVDNKEYWVKSRKPLRVFMSDGEEVLISLTKRTLTLPFEFNLTKFKMDKDPGTNNPASYESFVTTFSPEGPFKSHIYMNNPLKYAGFTFYQSSYFQDRNGQYGTVLSVNFDPGRFFKYLGSLILVLGAIWHFYLKKKKTA